MSHNQYSRGEKELSKFYDRIRLYLEELDLQSDKQTLLLEYEIEEEERYGKITKLQFENILRAYDRQQDSNSLKDKPVTCVDVTGNNFAQLLFSKTGFHHPGSTSYLTDELELRDTHLSSFLGGLTSYKFPKNQDIQGLQENRRSLGAKKASKIANQYLDKKEAASAYLKIKEAFELDANSCDAFAARGRYLSSVGRNAHAILDFKESMKINPGIKDSIREALSKALFQHGLSLYIKGDHKKALAIFEEALEYDKDLEEAEFHKNLCINRIRTDTPFAPKLLLYRK